MVTKARRLADHINEVEDMFAKRVDFSADGLTIYKGWADIGTADSAATWRIQRITFTAVEGDATTLWADGDGNFDNIWDNRESLSYS